MNTGNIIFWSIFCIIFMTVNGFAIFNSQKHISYIRSARKVYRTINNISNYNEGWLIAYLRKIDPYVFEELILLAFRKKGYRIKRNKRYTHDGGIDGKVFRVREKYLIQAKRYGSYISGEHVKQFSEICRKNKCYGYFIHTGKTGSTVRNEIPENVRIISGKYLYELFIEKEDDVLYFGRT